MSVAQTGKRWVEMRPSIFVTARDQPRARRSSDVVTVCAGLVVAALGALAATRSLAIESTIADVVAELPGWVEDVLAIGYGLALVYVLVLALVAVWQRRWDVFGYLVLAAALAVLVGLLLARWIEGEWPIVLPELGNAAPVARFPVIRVAAVTAGVAATAPFVVRPLRRFGWLMVGTVFITGVGLGLGVPSDAIGAVGLGLVAAGIVLLARGSPAGYPGTADVAAQLADRGIPLEELHAVARQSWGVRTLVGVRPDGTAVRVKAYGRDARDAQLAARSWRFLWYRDIGPSIPASRLQQVEHEALVLLLAGRAGVSVPAVLFAATTPDDDAILVTDQRGVGLDELAPDLVSAGTMAAVWGEVRKLHDAGLSHGSLDASAVRIANGTPILSGFNAGAVSAPASLQAIDVAELLFSLSTIVGVDAAVAAARDGLGNERLAAAIPYIQLPALKKATKRGVDHPWSTVKQVHAAALAATGADEPEKVQLRRITVMNVLFTVLIAFTGWIIIRQLAQVDVTEIWDAIKGAEWAYVAVAFVVAQLILVSNATALMSVVTASLPLRPTILLESAIQFIGFAVPSTAARVATNVAYLTKYGMTAVTAITQGALDSFAGFLVQMAILIVAFAFGNTAFDVGGDSSASDANWAVILGIAVALAVAGVAIVFLVKAIRTRVLSAVQQAAGALRVLVDEPRRAVTLFLSVFATQALLGIAMWLCVKAFGIDISVGTALTVVVAAVLLGGLAPTPGGVGVQEAVLSAGLVAAGVPANQAFGAAIVYRAITFFLPPIWGLVSFRYLQKNGYL
jgi:glycosyltransferase 2 family protein